MPYYRRSRTPGATYFFTVTTYHRQHLLTHPDVLTALRKALHLVRDSHPFKIDAMVVLPDHLHTIWTLPADDANYAKRWNIIKRRVSQSARDLVEQPQGASRIKRREIGFWQRRYWEHQIRDETSFSRHVDYIYFNPVKHCYVERVGEWPHSTFHRDVRLGVYPADWAGGDHDGQGEFGE